MTSLSEASTYKIWSTPLQTVSSQFSFVLSCSPFSFFAYFVLVFYSFFLFIAFFSFSSFLTMLFFFLLFLNPSLITFRDRQWIGMALQHYSGHGVYPRRKEEKKHTKRI